MKQVPSRSRGGRPPASRAGEVEARLLDAAGRLFRERGFELTSCTDVAELARAGKASIYTRYANKEALFLAFVEHEVARSAADDDGVPSRELPLAERLARTGALLVERALEPGAVALLRLLVRETDRFPGLASHADAIWRQPAVRQVTLTIAGHGASRDEAERAGGLAATFVEHTLLPWQMRALLGEDLTAHQAREHVERTVTMLAEAGLLRGFR